MQAMEEYRHFSVPGLPFPSYNPPGFEEDTNEDEIFDEEIHLDISTPKWIKPLISDEHGECDWQFPITEKSINEEKYPGLAFTAPFRILSEAGVKEVRKIIARNEFMVRANERRPRSMRGLGYRSKFIRDLAYSPKLLKHLSRCVGKPMWPQDSQMNISQVNFGKVGDPRPVESWHLDR
jgi:hypothetical protein